VRRLSIAGAENWFYPRGKMAPVAGGMHGTGIPVWTRRQNIRAGGDHCLIAPYHCRKTAFGSGSITTRNFPAHFQA